MKMIDLADSRKLEDQSKQFSLARQQATNFKPLVLVAENHDDTRLMVKYFLEMSGFRVAEATDGENAVRLAEQSHPDLVLIDVSLPLLDGIAVTRHFRQSVSLPNLPVIFISAHAELRLRNEALAAGGNDYLVKPLDLKLLESAVEKHICRESGYGLFTEIL